MLGVGPHRRHALAAMVLSYRRHVESTPERLVMEARMPATHSLMRPMLGGAPPKNPRRRAARHEQRRQAVCNRRAATRISIAQVAVHRAPRESSAAERRTPTHRSAILGTPRSRAGRPPVQTRQGQWKQTLVKFGVCRRPGGLPGIAEHRQGFEALGNLGCGAP